MLLRPFFRKSRLTFAALLVLLSVVLSLSVWALRAKSRTSQQSGTLLLTNRTSTFQVISTERVGEYFKVRARNISHQAINGYSLLLADGSTIDCDYTISEHVIAPGEEEEFMVPAAAEYSSDSPAPQQKVDIRVAVFVDGKSEGDPKAADSIIQRRLGIKVQLKRILSLLRKLIDSQGDLTVMSGEFKSRVNLLAEQPEDGQPLEVRHGLHDAKDEILKMIQNIEQKQQRQGAVDWRDELLEVKKHSEKRLARL